MNIRIDKLYNNPQYKDLVYNWIYAEWGNNNPHYWREWLESSVADEGIPITYIIFDNEVVVGTFSLWRCDLQSRQDLFPWFGGFYIRQEYRGKFYNNIKLSYYVQNYALGQLKSMGYSAVYLFSEKDASYYEKNGWKFFGEAYNEKDERVFLCLYDLDMLEV